MRHQATLLLLLLAVGLALSAKPDISFEKVAQIFPFLTARDYEGANTPWALGLMYYHTHEGSEFHEFARSITADQVKNHPLILSQDQLGDLHDIRYLDHVSVQISVFKQSLSREFRHLELMYEEEIKSALGDFFTFKNFEAYYVHALMRMHLDEDFPIGIFASNELPLRKGDTPFLFMSYGIVPDENPHDKLYIQLDPTVLHNLEDGVVHYLQNRHHDLVFPSLSADGAGKELLPYIRLTTLMKANVGTNTQDLEVSQFEAWINTKINKPLPHEGEESHALELLAKYLKYLTTYDEGKSAPIKNEEEMLHQARIEGNAVMELMVKYRLNRKRLIKKIAEDAEKVYLDNANRIYQEGLASKDAKQQQDDGVKGVQEQELSGEAAKVTN